MLANVLIASVADVLIASVADTLHEFKQRHSRDASRARIDLLMSSLFVRIDETIEVMDSRMARLAESNPSPEECITRIRIERLLDDLKKLKTRLLLAEQFVAGKLTCYQFGIWDHWSFVYKINAHAREIQDLQAIKDELNELSFLLEALL